MPPQNFGEKFLVVEISINLKKIIYIIWVTLGHEGLAARVVLVSKLAPPLPLGRVFESPVVQNIVFFSNTFVN